MTRTQRASKRTLVRFVVARQDDDQLTYAIVRAVVKPGLEGETPFRQALIAALDGWLRHSLAGQAAWQDSSQDFNVGDLALEMAHPDPGLMQQLEQAGIYRLEIETISEVYLCQDWTFDTVLALNTI